MAPTGASYGPATGSRWFGLWDGYFAISYAVTTVLLFTSPGEQVHRAVSIGALTLIVVWYGVLGRDVMLHDGRGRRNTVFSAGLLALFATAAAFDLTASFALFAVVPMLMMSLSAPASIVLAMGANLLPVAVVRIRGGAFDPDILAVLPTSLLGMTLSVLLGLWITRVVGQSKERGALIAELRRSRESVARLSREAGVAAERERLAREIHDTLAQGLTSIISLVQAAEAEVDDTPDLARKHLGLAGRVARESLAEARDFVSALTPPGLRGSSLVQAVRRLADGLAEETGLAVRCSVEGEERPLPVAAGVVLLRSAQEAIANVRKHAAHARAVDVTVAYDDTTVRLVIRDDGEGFVPDGEQDGFGLRGMRARAAETGGAAVVSSSPGNGTTVEVSVPLDTDSGEPADE
ncbi:sensor histidine kinase [Streptomyces sp. NPDC088725]|uniref:sensor histidine kinase n=1 Tax=Streptomyces sp. NPDC088725 TaxID=3365873 RepID=UPI00382B2218